MKDKILSMIALITIFIPFTVIFVWNPADSTATLLLVGYCIFITVSFAYALFLFFKMRRRDWYTKAALGVNGLYLIGILVLVIIPRLMSFI